MAFKAHSGGRALLPFLILCGVLMILSGALLLGKERFDDAAESALNEVAIGCNDPGAALYLLNRSLANFGYKGGAPVRQLGQLPDDIADEFDYVHFLTTAEPEAYYFLFCKQGYLVAKCRRGSKASGSLADVYRQEVMSGKQHLPRLPGIEERIRWGMPAQVQETYFDGNPPGGEGKRHPQLRCGIVWTDPTGPRGYNLFVLIRNEDAREFRDQLCAEYFFLGSLNRIQIHELASDKRLTDVSLGVVGSEYAKLPGQTGKGRFAPVRLRPGESMFFGCNLSKDPMLKRIVARIQLYAADEESAREYILESGTASGAD